ncbi:alpha/beta hydrolase [Streptomyces sp. NPDC093085]|uniref:alpha/beta fold hydrolase n=1 Tax=Streptomyces sp. NPDC093085 TaxID=3155068 RepID=UPI0034194E15
MPRITPHTHPHPRTHSTNRSRLTPALLSFALLALTAVTVRAWSDRDSPATPSPPHPVRAAEGQRPHLVDNDGHRVAFYVTRGKGPTVVLDSGGGEDSSQWKDIVPRLHAATGATVITYDRAGLGKSDVVPGPWKAENAVSDLRAGLRELGVTGNITLVSHSQAGEIATCLARENPELLSGAVLVDANVPQFFTDEEIPRLVAATQPQVDAARKAPERPENRQLLATAKDFAPAHKAYHKVAWPDSVPATVLVSEKTPFEASPEDARRWREAAASFVRAAPNRTLVTAKSTSHEIPAERPDLVLQEIESMLPAPH